ncbi:MAG: SufS family cysteine desulfurase [Fuerstiella sp.]|nr:SufS family cysteine desulfurase [Fuerstiella sp.]
MTEITPSPFDAESVRSQFPVLNRELKQGRPVFLDSAASAQKPCAVIAKEREVEEQYFANAYRGRYSFGARIDQELEASRKKIASFIGAASGSQIAFTAGTTLGLNQVAFGWGRGRLRAGDEIVVTPMEHHANFVPWQQLARQTGATLKMLPLSDDGQLDVTAFDQVISRRTKIVAVCSMSNVLGTVNPIAEIAQRAHHAGAILVADGAQSVPHCSTDVTADDVDFLVFSGHKIYGPTGVGVIYGRADRLEEIEPIVFGGHMISHVAADHSEWAETPARLEAGTLPIVQAIALGTAVDWVTQTGLESIHVHEQSLLQEATRRLMQIPGMTIYGPQPEYKGAIIAFRIENLHPEDLAAMLDRCGVFTRHGHHCTMPLHELLGVTATTRASFAAYNTMEDVDKLVDAIQFARKKLRLV